MSKTTKLILVLVIGLSLCSCKNETAIIPPVESINNYKAIYEEDITNIDNACDYMDSLLLNDDIDLARDIFLETSKNIKTVADLDKVRQFSKYFEIRLVEIKNIDLNDGSEEIHRFRYDEKGRVITSGQTSYFYPDDGGDCYYYIYDYDKTGYDKDGNEVIRLTNNWFSDDESKIKYDDFYDYAYKYEYERDSRGNIIKKEEYGCTKDSKTLIEKVSYSYDENDNLIEKRIEYYYDYGNSTLVEKNVYDDHNNIIKSISKHNDSDENVIEYFNKYDELGFLIEKTTKYNDSSFSFTTIYEYDRVYNVVLSEKTTGDNDTIRSIEYKYEPVSSDSIYIGLNKDVITFVSHDAPKKIEQRKVITKQIKIRETPTIYEDNYHKDLVYKDDVVYVYSRLYNCGYEWYQIGENQWIADDGTWTEIVK